MTWIRGWMLICALGAIVALLTVRQRLSAQVVGNSALLFNYVVGAGGFDTVIGISNASLSQFGAVQRPGRCTLYYYGRGVNGSSAPAPQRTGFILPGTLTAFNLTQGSFDAQVDNRGAGFIGYMIVTCDFPLARGVAIVQDLGGQKFLAPIPATVIPAF